jgi:hypothetical protein
VTPLDQKTLAGIYRVAQNWVGSWKADVVRDLATAVTNDVHHAYLRGDIPKDRLLWYAKRRAMDAYRAEQARKVREAAAAEGRAEVIGRETTETDGHAERVQDIVDLDATQSSAGGSSINPTTLTLTYLATPDRDRRVRVSRGKTMANPTRNQDALIARLDAQRALAEAGPEAEAALAKALAQGRGRPRRLDAPEFLALLERAGVDLATLLAPSRRDRAVNRALAPSKDQKKLAGHEPAREEVSVMRIIEEIVERYGLEGPERDVYMGMGRVIDAIQAGREVDQADVLDVRRALRQRAVDGVMDLTGWPVEARPAVEMFAETGGFDRAIRANDTGWPEVFDDALPLILAHVDVFGLVHEGRLTQAEAEAMLPRIEDSVVEHWDDPAMCDGPWALTRPDGTQITLGFMERAYQMARKAGLKEAPRRAGGTGATKRTAHEVGQ